MTDNVCDESVLDEDTDELSIEELLQSLDKVEVSGDKEGFRYYLNGDEIEYRSKYGAETVIFNKETKNLSYGWSLLHSSLSPYLVGLLLMLPAMTIWYLGLFDSRFLDGTGSTFSVVILSTLLLAGYVVLSLYKTLSVEDGVLKVRRGVKPFGITRELEMTSEDCLHPVINTVTGEHGTSRTIQLYYESPGLNKYIGLYNLPLSEEALLKLNQISLFVQTITPAGTNGEFDADKIPWSNTKNIFYMLLFVAGLAAFLLTKLD